MGFDWLTGVVPIAAAAGGFAGGLVMFILQTWWKSRVESSAQRALVEFTHSLETTAEAARFEYQRRIVDISRFAEQRQESYTIPWTLLRTAHGRKLEVGANEDQTFEYYDSGDVEAYLVRKKFPSGKRNEILASWHEDRDTGIAKFRDVRNVIRRHEAETAWTAVNNAYVDRELFLSEAVGGVIQSLIVQLDALRVQLHDADATETLSFLGANREAYETLQKLRLLMQKELAGEI